MIANLKAKLENNQTGTTSTSDDRLNWALNVLGAKVKREDIFGYECMIIEAAESVERCSSCSKVGAETVDCCQINLTFENGRLYSQAGLCRKAQSYLLSQKIDRLFGGTCLGKRFKNRRFETFDVTAENQTAYAMCKRFCDTYKSDSTGILLTGNYGCGKTHLAAAIINEMLKKNVVGVFVVVPDLMRAIRRSFVEKDNHEIQQKIQELFKTVKTAELLILDDLGAEKASKWVQEQLFILINARYENMLPTIITTNKTVKKLSDEENSLGERITSRIVEMTDGVMIKATDYRMRKLGG